MSAEREPERHSPLPHETEVNLRRDTMPRPAVDIPELPIDPYLDEITRSVRENRVTILKSPTGTGKTLRVPRRLAEEGFQVVVSEPRIIATKASAMRAAEEHGSLTGEFVGYRTALYKNDSEDTRLLYCTDGLELVRSIMHDGRHRDVLVIDEIHEWNQHMEVLLAWSKRELERNPDFRLVIMSATLEQRELIDYFDEPSVIEIEGKNFEVLHEPAGESMVSDIVRLVEQGRHVLNFQPGKREIYDTIQELHDRGIDAEILPMHGSLTLAEQDLVFREPTRPTVVVSTNVTQTSVTIPYIDAVVDSGVARVNKVVDGIHGLYKESVSLDDSKQREGRAGRTKNGIYIDHCPKPRHKRPQSGVPELQRVRPDQAMLKLLSVGIDIEELDLLHSPGEEALHNARKTLHEIGAITKKGEITELGKEIADMPISPSGARMCLEAKRLGVLAEIIPAVAVFESGNLLEPNPPEMEEKPTRKYVPAWSKLTGGECDSDLLAQGNILAEVSEEIGFDGEIDDESLTEVTTRWELKPQAVRRAMETQEVLRQRLLGEEKEDVERETDHDNKLKAIAAGLVGNIYEASRKKKNWFVNSVGDKRELARESVVEGAEMAVGTPFTLEVTVTPRPSKTTKRTARNSKAAPQTKTKTISLFTQVSRIERSWLPEIAPHLVEESEPHSPSFSVNSGMVSYKTDRKFGEQVFDSRYTPLENHPRNTRTIAAWLANAMHDEKWDKRADQFTGLKEVWLENRAKIEKKKNSPAVEQLIEQYELALNGAQQLTADIDFSILKI